MQRALALAKLGQFSAAPNPCVGCVIVAENGDLVGEGYHVRAGEAHAEVNALKQAGTLAKGATAYVSLEPCAHYGRTPPCVNALIESGITKVVVACTDPNPEVAGKGIARLKAAGILVDVGLCEAEALWLNRAFFHRMQTGLPYVRLKMAASLDGRSALANGDSQWITGALARQDVHKQRLRADAVMAGRGSVIQDNARLTARYDTELERNYPIRVIVDSQLQTPVQAAVFEDLSPVVMATTQAARIKAYPAQVEILRLPERGGKVDLQALLGVLGERGINQILVEAGFGLASALLAQGCVNEILWYVAPILLGAESRPMLDVASLMRLEDAPRWQIMQTRRLGEDLRLTLIPANAHDRFGGVF